MEQKLKTTKLATTCTGMLELHNGVYRNGLFIGFWPDMSIPDHVPKFPVRWKDEPAVVIPVLAPCPNPLPILGRLPSEKSPGVQLFAHNAVLVKLGRKTRNRHRPHRFSLVSAWQYHIQPQRGRLITEATLAVDGDIRHLVIPE